MIEPRLLPPEDGVGIGLDSVDEAGAAGTTLVVDFTRVLEPPFEVTIEVTTSTLVWSAVVDEEVLLLDEDDSSEEVD